MCVLAAAFAVSNPGCKAKDEAGKATPTASNPGNNISINSADGKTTLILQEDDNGYQLADAAGKNVGRIRIEGDKIKMRDGVGRVSKARRNGDVFIIYARSKVVLKAKKRGKRKFRLRTGEDAEMGMVRGNEITLTNGETIVATTVGGKVSVTRAGKQLFTVTKLTGNEAVFLGLTEITLQQRVAAALASARW